MKNVIIGNHWSLKDLGRDFYAQFDIEERIIEATIDVIDSILNPEADPEVRLIAYKTLDQQLQGNNAVFRMLIVMSISGAAEVQAAVANGCGPSGLGIFPGGWWKRCCDEHDECYHQGGSAAAKLICDARFWKCLWSKGAPIIAEIYGVAVLLFGWFAFDWGGDEEAEPDTCSGTCKGKEFRVTDLRNFETVGRSVADVLLEYVPPYGVARLEVEAQELSTTRWSIRCRSGCHCKVLATGEWQRSVTFLTVPGNDPDAHVNFHCQATMWQREVSGTCK